MTQSGGLPVSVSTFNGGVVLRPSGDIDLSRSSSLRQAIADVNRSQPARLIIDLTEVGYMDSSGVATLVEALQLARRHGTRLDLCGLQPRVHSIFEIARLDGVFSIHSDLEAAIASS